MAVKTPDSKEEQDEAYNPGALHAAEQFPSSYASHGIDQLEAFANDPKNATETQNVSQNIDAAKEKEKAGAGWNYTGKSSSGRGLQKPTTFFQAAKKKGPLGVIGLILGGGGLGIGTLLSPTGALLHIKQIITNKVDSMSSIRSVRSNLVMKDRMLNTNTLCKIKIRCKFTGLTKTQISNLRLAGGDLLDKDGKPVTGRKIAGLPGTTRFVGGKTIVMPSGEKVPARDYLKTLKTSPELRDLSLATTKSRWFSWSGKAGKQLRADRKLTTNPDWGKEGDQKAGRQSIYKETSDGQSHETQTRNNQGKDKNGKPIKQDSSNSIDLSDATDQVNSEGKQIQKIAEDGGIIPQIPSDVAGAVAMPEDAIKSSALSKVFNLLNPASLVVGVCTTYQITKAVVLTSQIIGLTNAMRYASVFLSTADKLKAGDGSADEVNKAMTILEREDQYGDAFGDAAGYQYPEYGTVPDKPIASSASGNSVILLMSSVLGWINDHIGKELVNDGCKIMKNPFVQGALALTTFIPGGGQIAKGVTKVLSVGIKKAAQELIKRQVKKMTDQIAKAAVKGAVKDALKSAGKTVGKTLGKMAASAAGIFLAQYLADKYALPYLSHVLFAPPNGSEPGSTAIDIIFNGADAQNSGTAQNSGMTPLTKDEYEKFNAFNTSATATYVADMQAKSNPLDLNDPYSAGNSLASAFYTFSSSLNIGQGSTNLLSIPATILSNLNPAGLFSKNASAATPAYCNDNPYLNEKNLATSPFCNVQYGFNDLDMLQNTDPEDVVDWMLDHKQITDSGDPVDGSDYAKFKEKCVDNTDTKIISDLADDDQEIDPSCYDEAKNKTEAYKMYRLYTIDTNVTDDMDSDDSSSSAMDDSTPVASFYDPSQPSTPAQTNVATNMSTKVPKKEAKATLPNCISATPTATLLNVSPFSPYVAGSLV